MRTQIKKSVTLEMVSLVASIKHELAKGNEVYKPLSSYHSVWFQPSLGRFLFGDRHLKYEVVESLIDNKTLIFNGVESHQGEEMLRYVLREPFIRYVKTNEIR